MYVHAAQISLLLVLSFHPPSRNAIGLWGHTRQEPASQNATEQHPAPGLSKQLFAVRGEVTKMESQSKGMVAITVRPAHEATTVTVIARENDVVGTAAGRKSADIVGLLAGEDQRENEKITAAEIREGDLVSIIYDPAAQNRVLEIYIH